MLLPHESTVAHEQRFTLDAPMIQRTRSKNPGTPNDQPAAAVGVGGVEEDSKEVSVSLGGMGCKEFNYVSCYYFSRAAWQLIYQCWTH